MSTPKVPSNEKSAPDPPLVRTDEDEVVLGPWRVPTSFKWLAMPTRPSDTADIVWSDGVPMKARYFKCTAFWGTLSYLGPAMPKLDATAGGPKPVSKPGYHVNPHGQSISIDEPGGWLIFRKELSMSSLPPSMYCQITQPGRLHTIISVIS